MYYVGFQNFEDLISRRKLNYLNHLIS